MGQLTVYVDDTTLKRIEIAAKHEHESVSRWVKKHLVHALHHTWPKRYFDDVFGAAVGERFERPAQPRFADDVRQGRL